MSLKKTIISMGHFYSGIPLAKWVLLKEMVGAVMSK